MLPVISRQLGAGSTNLRDIKKEFSKQSSVFESDWSAKSKTSQAELMAWVMQSLNETKCDKALDVAAGTGILARSLASSGFAKEVVALDATREMMEEGRKAVEKDDITNVTFIEGDALNLPFEDDLFDVVGCRLCLHHFPDPGACVKEMTRVCKDGGTVIVIDIISDENKFISDEQNRLENLRDPTHTRFLTKSELVSIFMDCGITPFFDDQNNKGMLPALPTFTNVMDLKGWMQSTNTSSANQQVIEECILKELDHKGHSYRTGFQPFRSQKHNDIAFLHNYAIAQGFKGQNSR